MKQKDDAEDDNKLTKREKEIAQLIADGFTNPMIAEKLIISEHTVNTHRKKIFKKLDVHNIASLIKKLTDTDSKTLKKAGKKKK